MPNRVLAVALLAFLGTAQAETTLEWHAKAYGDGKHNAFTDLVRWHDSYYIDAHK